MFFDHLSFSNLQWFWPVLCAGVLAVLVLAWSYRASAPGAARWVCVGLKILGIATLALCLLEPLWTGQRARPGANSFAIVADNSQGLRITDPGDLQTRGDKLATLLGQNQEGWQADLVDTFDLRRFTFDSRLQAVRNFDALHFDGRASALGSALQGVKARFEGQPLAGILLFTDGNATDLRTAPDATGLAPVYPVVVGEDSVTRDAGITQVAVTQTAFEDAPVTIQADVSAMGLAGEPILAQLFDSSGNKLQELLQRPRRSEESLAFRFQIRPPKPGLSFYQVRVGLKDELPRSAPDSDTEEATLLNNDRIVAVDRGHGPYRVLYVAGRPNWEYKFLHRAEEEDDQVQLVGLIRAALREGKFEFRGRSGETGNPLFRGFGDQSREEVERYDQPVLVRLNTRDETELSSGFPSVPEDLYCYDAVILDDVESAFFTLDQSTLLQRFVSERGGGFLMLGGMESFKQGGYLRTPIGDMLPVYLDRPVTSRPDGEVRLNLSREGWLQAWARLRENESDERTRLDSMPPFQVFNTTEEIKPAASIIATARDDQGKQYPALVTQRFGHGRVAALMVGDIWRWGMQNPEAHRDMDKSWRQLVRWLVSDVPKRIEFTTQIADSAASGGVHLQVRVRNPKFQPVDEAAVTVEITPVLLQTTNQVAHPIHLRLEPSPKESGLYEADYVPHETCGYRATAYVTNFAGAELGRAETGWSSDLAAEEFKSLRPNVALLEDIARRTGGKVISASKLKEFARGLPEHSAPVMEAWTFPAWHTPLLFAFALACFAGEWGLRRWKGLP